MHPRKLASLLAIPLPLARRAALAGAAALALATAAGAEKPVIYKWVDEHGVAHYTTDRGRIPASIRDRVVEGSEAARSADWLRKDAGTAPPAGAPLARTPGATTPMPAATAPGARNAAEGVELPEEASDVHAVESQPDWSQAPGGEETWAPGELGEEGQASAPAPQPPAPAEPARANAARAPMPPPPPPPLPSIEADGAPIAADGTPIAPPPDEAPLDEAPLEDESVAAVPVAPARAVEPAPVAEPEDTVGASFETEEAEPALEAAPGEPPTPAAVAAPAPRELGPDEQQQLAALDAQIAEVEAKIAQDEEALMVLISAGEEAGTPQGQLVDDPRFRDIAQRLPKLQADLERLRERRAQIEPSVSRP